MISDLDFLFRSYCPSPNRCYLITLKSIYSQVFAQLKLHFFSGPCQIPLGLSSDLLLYNCQQLNGSSQKLCLLEDVPSQRQEESLLRKPCQQMSHHWVGQQVSVWGLVWEKASVALTQVQSPGLWVDCVCLWHGLQLSSNGGNHIRSNFHGALQPFSFQVRCAMKT